MARLEIAGGIGSGKTTLARVFAGSGAARLVQEDVLSVPFFTKFYAAPNVYGFQKNLSFLLSHAGLIQDASKDRNQFVVCDLALFQDLAYTDIICSQTDVAAVESVYQRLVAQVGHPTFVVHLRCAPDTQLRHVARRGRTQETGIDRAYLVDLCAAIDRRLDQLRAASPGVTVISVDTDEMDYADGLTAAQAEAARLMNALQNAQLTQSGNSHAAEGQP